MIVGLKGKVVEIYPNSIYFNVQDVIFEIFTTLIDLESIKVGNSLEISIQQIIREDSNLLYGFLKKETKLFFNELIKISGVGAKVAITILSAISESELVDIIERQDEKALVKVPKIGLKTAKRILNELIEVKEKFSIANSSIANSEKNIAIQALEQLGFNKINILKTINNTEKKTHQEMIKDALARLVK